jgi:hypothetical protein
MLKKGKFCLQTKYYAAWRFATSTLNKTIISGYGLTINVPTFSPWLFIETSNIRRRIWYFCLVHGVRCKIKAATQDLVREKEERELQSAHFTSRISGRQLQQQKSKTPPVKIDDGLFNQPDSSSSCSTKRPKRKDEEEKQGQLAGFTESKTSAAPRETNYFSRYLRLSVFCLPKKRAETCVYILAFRNLFCLIFDKYSI